MDGDLGECPPAGTRELFFRGWTGNDARGVPSGGDLPHALTGCGRDLSCAAPVIFSCIWMSVNFNEVVSDFSHQLIAYVDLILNVGRHSAASHNLVARKIIDIR